MELRHPARLRRIPRPPGPEYLSLLPQERPFPAQALARTLAPAAVAATALTHRRLPARAGELGRGTVSLCALPGLRPCPAAAAAGQGPQAGRAGSAATGNTVRRHARGCRGPGATPGRDCRRRDALVAGGAPAGMPHLLFFRSCAGQAFWRNARRVLATARRTAAGRRRGFLDRQPGLLRGHQGRRYPRHRGAAGAPGAVVGQLPGKRRCGAQ